MKLKIIASLISTACCANLYAAQSDQSNSFDVNILKSRGLSPDLATFFQSAKRFTEGPNYVTLLVNGIKLGTTDAQFDAQGELCVTPALLNFAQISLPDEVANKATASTVNEGEDAPSQNTVHLTSTCINLVRHYPQTIIKLRPSLEQVELVVPPEALRNTISSNPAAGVTTGGTAALINYDVLDARSRYPGGNSHTLQAMTEVGLNTHEWIIRSRQSYSNSNGRQQFNNINAYAQKTFAEKKAVLQTGQINPISNLFSLPTLLGAQVIPESALMSQVGGGVSASGIAQSEARVEIRQKGTLIYSTLVPPGPFTLSQLPIIDSNADLLVRVIENGGAERAFIVPASSFNIGFVQTEKSFSFAIGRRDQPGVISPEGSGQNRNWLATADASVPWGERASLSAGTVLTTDYHGVGAGISTAPTRNTSVNLRNVLSHQTRSGAVGAQVQINGAAQLSRSLSLNMSLQRQTKKFRNVGDPIITVTGVDDFSVVGGYKQQQTSNLSYQHDTLGSLGVGYSAFTGFNNNNSRRMSGSWSRSFGRTNVSLSFEHSAGVNKDNAVFLSLNIPLGPRSVNASTSHQGDRILSNVSVSEQVNDYVGYSASASADNSGKQVGTSANVNLLPKYTQINLGASNQDGGSSSFNSSMSGGVVVHKNGITLSPYRVQDNFAVVSVPGVTGAKVNTPQGPVWTDFTGRAVAPSLPSYNDGRLELVTKSLPRTTDVKTGIRSVRLGHGAVTNVDFNIIVVRRALIRVLNKEKRPIEKGTAIFDESGAWITSVGNDGSIFLDDKQLMGSLKAADAAGNACTFSYQFPKNIDQDVLYETADVTCN